MLDHGNPKLLTAALSVAILAAGACAAGQAQAAPITRNYLIQPAANCQGNLPNSEGNLRKRPLAIANEGTSTAFVTCGFQDINNGGTGTVSVTTWFINRSPAPVTVNCTLVNGIWGAPYFSVGFFPKSVTIAPAAPPTIIQWTAAADNAGSNFVAPSLSCALPAQTDLSLINHVFPEEIGT